MWGPYKGMLFTIPPFAKRLMQENHSSRLIRDFKGFAPPTPPASTAIASSHPPESKKHSRERMGGWGRAVQLIECHSSIVH